MGGVQPSRGGRRARAALLPLLLLLLPSAMGWAPGRLLPAPTRSRVASCRRTGFPQLQVAPALSRDAPAPTGPDPYKLVREDLDYIKASIKKTLNDNKGGSAITANEVLTMAAREFTQRKGKSFRPMLVLLIGRATDADGGAALGTRHYKLAVIAEMIHTASLIHADVLEEDATDPSQGTMVHQEVDFDVGNKVCILAGDFLLSRASVELSLLDNADITEIVAQGLEAICEGGMLAYEAAMVPEAPSLTLESYLHHTARGTGKLIGNTCQCSAILSGHSRDSQISRACMVFGEEVAMAQQLVSEAEEMETLLKRCRRNKRKWPSTMSPSAPLLLAAEDTADILDMLSRGFDSEADVERTIGALERSKAIARTRELATDHAQGAVDALQALPNSATRSALLVLCHKVLTGTPLK